MIDERLSGATMASLGECVEGFFLLPDTQFGGVANRLRLESAVRSSTQSRGTISVTPDDRSTTAVKPQPEGDGT
jgi:hypothetical protein